MSNWGFMSLSRGSSKNNVKEKDVLAKIRPNSPFPWLACFSYQGFCLAVFLLLAALILAMVVAIAKTGLVEIPLFSSLFYQEPQPLEVVNSAAGFTLENKINLSETLQGKLTIILTQEELTALINQSDKFSKAQIAIDELEVELFVLTPLINKREVYLTVRFIPRVTNSKLDFKITKTKIGQLPLPTFLANFAKNILIQFYGDKLLVLNKMKLEKVDIKKRGLILTTHPL